MRPGRRSRKRGAPLRTDLLQPTVPAVCHELLDIVTIALCAVLCGADTWVDVELFGRSNEPRLRTFLELPHGVPSHATFESRPGGGDPVRHS
jgi:DDE_Tnp_1-associated